MHLGISQLFFEEICVARAIAAVVIVGGVGLT
jgi:hypothetical protein